MIVHPWMWVAFVAFVLLMLFVDLFVFHREAKSVPMREATLWSIVWIVLGLSFGAFLWWWQGSVIAGEYIAGYLIEKALSVDNIFVFALVFSYFGLPDEFQHRVLFWGVLGALVFRAAFIAAGAALLEAFHPTIYIFGAFLVYTGIRMARHQEMEVHPEANPVLRVLRRYFPITPIYQGQRFFVHEGGRTLATPLFAVLVVVETTDIIFAVDSIPAIFAVTKEPFVVFTSNAFAILGLRALFFVLAGMIRRFQYLKVGLSAVLVFVGAKMLLSDIVHLPIWLSLGVIAGVLTVSVVASLMGPPPPEVDLPAGPAFRPEPDPEPETEDGSGPDPT